MAGSNALPAAVCLFGPTGTGKSDLAIRLASELNLEIVSVDSAMVYRRMDIGTAKPDKRVRERVAHHLVDIREPWESYSAGQFRNEALSVMADICARGRTPLLVGGTMLYFRALLRGLAELPSAHPGGRAAIGSRHQTQPMATTTTRTPSITSSPESFWRITSSVVGTNTASVAVGRPWLLA